MSPTSAGIDGPPTMGAVDDWFSGRRVAVLGGLGFIGSAVVLRLAELGARVQVVDALLDGFGGDRRNVPDSTPNCDVHEIDVRDGGLEKLLEGVEVVVNAVGQVSHQRSMADPLGDLEANCRSQIYILEACRRISPTPVVVYAGTRQVYGRARELPITESVPALPVDINGVDKYAGEEYHRIYGEVHGLRTVRLRLTNTYGPRQSLEAGSQGVIPTFIRRGLRREPLRIFGDGEQRRDVTHVDDVTNAILATAATPAAHGQVFNLGSDRPISVKDIAGVIATNAGVEVEFVGYPEELKSIEIGDSWSSYDRLQMVTGWRPGMNFEEGMRKTMEFYREHPEYWRDA